MLNLKSWLVAMGLSTFGLAAVAVDIMVRVPRFLTPFMPNGPRRTKKKPAMV